MYENLLIMWHLMFSQITYWWSSQRDMISEWIAKVKIECICHQSTVVLMDSRCWSIDDRSSVPERGDIYIPPTPDSSWGWHWHTLLLLWCKRSFSCAWGEKKLNSSILTWSEDEEWSSEVAETSTKWAGRWCNACYSAPVKLVVVFRMDLAFVGAVSEETIVV